MKRQMIERTDTHYKLMDEDGVVKKVALATPGQMAYIQSLRSQLGKEPLKSVPPVFAAAKMIDRLLSQTRQTKLLQQPPF